MKLAVEGLKKNNVEYIETTRTQLKHVVENILSDKECRLSTCLAYDGRGIDGALHVAYIFTCHREGRHIIVDVPVDPATASMDSLYPLTGSPACTWCEAEARDLYGIKFRGNPWKGRLVLPDTWPKNIHPMRKDAPRGKPPVEPEKALKKKPRPGIPLGPYHPALHEPEYFELHVIGEKVVDVWYRGFFVYRGIEKLAEDRFLYHQVPFLAERICGICGFVHSTTYCMAVEAALGIEVPERAKYIRTVLLELERIHSHLLCTAAILHTVGYDTGFMHIMNAREEVMDAAEIITGNRKTYSANTPGGVRVDIDESMARTILEKAEKAVTKGVKLAREYAELDEVKTRLEETGILDRKDAWKWGALGPVARASGIDIDMRRDKPYAAYENVEFEVPVMDEGDSMARYMIRLEEALESLKILKQVLKDLPKTPLRAEGQDYKPFHVGLAASEAPRGECLHYIITGRGKRLWRWKIRSPTYNNLALLPNLLVDRPLADAPVILMSIDPCFSCTDRVILVELDKGRRRSVSLARLTRP
ncbi:MAG: hydrogenase large subunit [Crenarchaeota archaeon]|nr:hydrogenase large subunit [Thermoproteota archaeon]